MEQIVYVIQYILHKILKSPKNSRWVLTVLHPVLIWVLAVIHPVSRWVLAVLHPISRWVLAVQKFQDEVK